MPYGVHPICLTRFLSWHKDVNNQSYTQLLNVFFTKNDILSNKYHFDILPQSCTGMRYFLIIYL